MEMFQDGGLKDQGETVDQQSNNPVPVGSTKKEVRDDIPANLSEGEFVLPADVVRYHGLEKIMGFRDQAKQGLDKMNQMGQMGNSDQATLPDNISFSDNSNPLATEKTQMAEGGVVPPTVQQPQVVTQNQVPGVQYVAPTTQALRPSVYQQLQQVPQVNVPTQPTVNVPTAPSYQTPAYRQPTNTAATPKFSNLLGTQFGQLQESVTKKYVNAETGEEMYIPFVNGEPVYPIPTGFIEESEVAKTAQDEDINKAVRSTSVRQEQDSENPVNTNEQEQDYKVAMQLARYDDNEKSSKDKSMIGSIMDFAEKYLNTGIPGQVIDALTPDYQRQGGFATFGASAAENKALDGGANSPSYLDSLARESGYASVDAMTKQYGVKPSFSFGTKPGDVSVVTGKPYNFAGQSIKKDGTIAYTSWGSWTDDLSDSYDTGWNGGFTSEKDIQDAMNAHDSRVNRGIAGYTTLSKDSAGGKKGGWDRSKVDTYKDLKAEKAGGYIDKTIVNGIKGPNYGNFVKGKPTDSKSSSNIASTKYVPTAREIKELTGGLDDYNVKTKTKDPSVMSPGDKFMGLNSRIDLENKAIEDAYNRSNQADLDRQRREVIALSKDATAGNMEQREIDNQQRNERSKQALTASSTFYDDNNSEGPSQDSDTSYSGSGVGGWTAKGGFINKRTMTMSKTPPNKKKRGGLASRK